MRFSFLQKLLCASLLGCATILPAQTFIPRSIVFEGTPQYSQADLLAASGLQFNKPVSQADLDAATQRLGDIGVFTNITFTTSGTALKFTLEPTPAEQMRKVVYTNFVMFEPPDLNGAVHQRVPLFNGTVPVSGSMPQSVERALEDILKQRGITASVTSIGNQKGQLDYAIATPPVRVEALAIAGADIDGTPSLRDIRSRVLGSDFITDTSGSTLRSTLLDAYADLGFQDAAITPIGHNPPQITPGRIAVTLTGTATPGALYRVSKLDFPFPAPGVSAPEMIAAAQLRPGDPASRIQLLSTSARLTSAFSGHGYLDAKTTITEVKDVSTRTIAYTFHETPGEQYRMHLLQPNNMSTQQASTAAADWKLAPGQVFELSRLTQFLHNAPGNTLCGGRPPEPSLVPLRATHEVDVILACVAPHAR